jgi:phospholipid/cholesterol/gamma-HCH transport system permease protein
MALDRGNQNGSEKKEECRAERLLMSPFAFIGQKVIGWINVLGTATVFLFMALWKTFRPKQFPKVVQQIYYIGASSTTIIILVGLFTGMVLGLQSYHALIQFGAVGGLGALVSLSLIREIGTGSYGHYDYGQSWFRHHGRGRYPANFRADRRPAYHAR